MSVQKKGLGSKGRGLEALISRTENISEKGVAEIDINKISPNREQPRSVFDEEALEELASSIKQVGVIQPVILAKDGDYYRIIAGERRWRAAKIAGIEKIPAIIKDYDEGLAIMNASPYANGSVLYTQSGYYASQFARYTDGGQVGINVGIPVPVGFVPFSGHKQSFFGDLHCLGKDAYRFFTESKSVTQHWFDEEEKKAKEVDTWDGLL